MTRIHPTVKALISSAKATAEAMHRYFEAGRSITVELIDGTVVRRQTGQPDEILSYPDR